MNRPRLVVVATHWRESGSELAFIARSVAAAASRWADTAVLVPGIGPEEPDGAFDLGHIGRSPDYAWPQDAPREGSIVVDEVTKGLDALMAGQPARDVFYLGGHAECSSWRQLRLTSELDPTEPFVRMFVPVNPLAEAHRHNGFGFTGYVLVLSDRVGTHDEPPSTVAWLTAAFPEQHLIVVENAVASAWKARTLRGQVPVTTRMDLWRLLAHAGVCIDLAPGHLLARECIEALRFGTPLIVPRRSGAAVQHAIASGGATFADAEQLINAVGRLKDPAIRSRASENGRRYAETTYGDPAEFTRSLRLRLSLK
jgi:hypothetical protein